MGRDCTLYAEYDGTVRFVHWNVRVQRKGVWETHRRVYMCVEPTPEVAANLFKVAPPSVEPRPPSDLIPPFTKERLLQLTLRKTQLPEEPAQLLARTETVDAAVGDRAFAASVEVLRRLSSGRS